MSSRYFVGIDLHKDAIQVCVLAESQQPVFEQRHEIKTLEQGLAMVASLKRFASSGRFEVEGVGMNRWFVDACREAGYDVVVVDPTRLGLRMLVAYARELDGVLDGCARRGSYGQADE